MTAPASEVRQDHERRAQTASLARRAAPAGAVIVRACWGTSSHEVRHG